MPVASGAESRVAYVAEVTPGTTPATPTFKVARVTSAGAQGNKTTVRTDEVQPDRNVRDELLVADSAGGSYNFELSYASFDDILEGVMASTWATNVLKNGVTRKYFTFEETLEQGTTDTFLRYPMSMIGSLNLEIAARSKITGNFAIQSQKETVASAIISGATYTAPNTKTPMSSGLSVASLTVGGLNPQPRVKSINLSINQNLREIPVVDSLFSAEYGWGLMDITGRIQMYFEDSGALSLVRNHSNFALSFTLGTTTLEKYTFSLPSCVFLDGAHPIGGANDDVMLDAPFRAKYDTGIAASLQITRAVA